MSYLSLEAIPLPDFYQVCFGKHGKIGDLSKKKAVIYKLQVEVSPHRKPEAHEGFRQSRADLHQAKTWLF